MWYHLLVQGRELSWLVINLRGGLCQPPSANSAAIAGQRDGLSRGRREGNAEKDDPSLAAG